MCVQPRRRQASSWRSPETSTSSRVTTMGWIRPSASTEVGKFFQLLFVQLLSLPLRAIDNDGVDFDRVKFAGCHLGTRTLVDGFGDETVRHRASFQTQAFKAGGISAFDRRSARAGLPTLPRNP